ncbi:unnamed protein product [Leptidea sinapis]|uniref:Uncharacterized protein n=1 Tax=Leptidea sinapis TaxID=189913 RepID=A0A5E4R465_9NEOP|nr:unnamed protein product [Leptidea sinapis]
MKIPKAEKNVDAKRSKKSSQRVKTTEQANIIIFKLPLVLSRCQHDRCHHLGRMELSVARGPSTGAAKLSHQLTQLVQVRPQETCCNLEKPTNSIPPIYVTVDWAAEDDCEVDWAAGYDCEVDWAAGDDCEGDWAATNDCEVDWAAGDDCEVDWAAADDFVHIKALCSEATCSFILFREYVTQLQARAGLASRSMTRATL